jgi:trimethylamine--corrinoid protein Co-methyltransferase
MKFQVEILSEAEQEHVHQTSLKILAEVGIRFHGEKALPILAQHGAKIDWDEKIARIPYQLVEQSLATAPKHFVLGARNPTYDHQVPSTESRYCIDGTAAFVSDFQTGQRRYGRQSDIIDSLRIFQTLDLGVMAWAPTCASDKPSQSRALHEFFSMGAACSKHGQHELHRADQVPYLIEGLVAILGGEEALKQRNCYSLIYCTVAPLSHEGEMLDAYLELGEYNLPVAFLPMPVCGTTGPASLMGNICVANAENLSALVIYQLAHPGRPVMYGSATGVMDFMSGSYLAGVPEMGLMSAALTAMAHYYALPNCSAGITADAMQPGPEAILQKVLTTLPPASMNTDIIIGYGEVEGDQLLVLEQLIVDNEIAHLCRRILQGVDGGEGKDLFEDIRQVGPSGHFLKARSTRSAPRSGEFYISRLGQHSSHESWLQAGEPTIYTRARQQVAEILQGPQIDPLPGEVMETLEQILQRADAELEGGD